MLLLTVLATSANGGNGISAANTLFGSIYSLSAGACVAGRRDRAGGRRSRWCVVLPAAAALDARPRAGDGARSSGAGARRGVPRAARGGDSRDHPGGRRAAVARAARRSGRGGAPADRQAVPRGCCSRRLLAAVSMWGGLALGYAIPSLPPSSAIIGLAAAGYSGSGARPRAAAPAPRGPAASTGTSGRARGRES